VVPVAAGAIQALLGHRTASFMISVFNTLGSLLSIVLSFYITGMIFTDSGRVYMTEMFEGIPFIQSLFSSQSLWHYIITVFVFAVLISGILHLLSIPLYRYLLYPLADRIAAGILSMPAAARTLTGAICQLPRSVCLVLIFSLCLNLFSSYYGDPAQVGYIKSSSAYQTVDKKVLEPLLGSTIAKEVPVLFKDSFKKAAESLSQSTVTLQGMKYFNGMTLDEAIKSSDEINSKALEIGSTGKNDKRKAFRIYEWVTENVQYDYNKMKIIDADPSAVTVPSGAIVAFDTGKGICFDYACLYVAMCRAAGLKVRLVTGLGFGGREWGDHAWNQVYSSQEKRWINVDTTFGSISGDYFDPPDFFLSHKDSVIQGEW
jgi:hypothetical protein